MLWIDALYKMYVLLLLLCLEEAFLLSASLEIIGQYNLWDKLPSLPCDRNEMVKLVADQFCDAMNILCLQPVTNCHHPSPL